MDLPESASCCRKFTVLVKVQGPDPKGLKMRKHAFHQYNSGNTTLSASGMLLPSNLYSFEAARRLFEGVISEQNLALILTVASVVEPFLPLSYRSGTSQDRLELIPGAHIDIMAEGQLKSEKEAPCWFPARLLSLVDVPVSSAALHSLIEASLGSKDYGWDVGWSLVSYDSQPSIDISQMQEAKSLLEGSRRHVQLEESFNPSFVAKSACRMAILGVYPCLLAQPNITLAPSSNRGDLLLAVGSPFGILSPVHFFNCVSVGSIANCYPPGSSKRSLLIADVRCLPGTEGGPVFDRRGHFVGILIRPLRQKNSSVEIQMVIPWGAIATAYSELLLEESNGETGTHQGNLILTSTPNAFFHDNAKRTSYEVHKHHHGPSFPVEAAVAKGMESICLITVNDGVWASGVLLNEEGLILTNAHLLEPWRFGKGGVNGERNQRSSETHVFGDEVLFSSRNRMDQYQKSHNLPHKPSRDLHASVADGFKEYKHRHLYSGRRDIHVRLDHLDPWVWCPAEVVYICQGPLDVALLQLEYVHGALRPIVANFSCPPSGSRAHVIGHGIFGPRSGLSPSISSGVVAKVVKAKTSQYAQFVPQDETGFPAMLETTAAVHPGGSGGAVVNSSGHMIGLVTSNARHGAGTVIPHLNFSVPCAILAPIFEFAKDMQNITVLQTLDQPNEELSSIWALMPPLSPKPKASLPGLPPPMLDGHMEQKKGSQFAKFIAETRNIIGSSQRGGKQEKLSNNIAPSKL